MTTIEDVSRRRASPRRFVSLSFDDARRPWATEKQTESAGSAVKKCLSRVRSAPQLKKPSRIVGRAR
jgi:hypothetical protein